MCKTINRMSFQCLILYILWSIQRSLPCPSPLFLCLSGNFWDWATCYWQGVAGPTKMLRVYCNIIAALLRSSLLSSPSFTPISRSRGWAPSLAEPGSAGGIFLLVSSSSLLPVTADREWLNRCFSLSFPYNMKCLLLWICAMKIKWN